MRKIIASLLILSVFTLLTSCSKTGSRGVEELVLEIRADFLAAERLVIAADITADYGDRVYDFGVRYTVSDGGGVIELLSPDEVAGITAEVTPDGFALLFDGARLDTGALTESGMSPAEALPVLLTQWREGFIKLSGFERLGESDTVALETDITATTAQKTWFDKKTLLPLRAELSENGVMVISCSFDNVVIEE